MVSVTHFSPGGNTDVWMAPPSVTHSGYLAAHVRLSWGGGLLLEVDGGVNRLVQRAAKVGKGGGWALVTQPGTGAERSVCWQVTGCAEMLSQGPAGLPQYRLHGPLRCPSP